MSEALFDASPAPMLVLAPDPPRLTITGVNQAYLAATMTSRAQLIGLPLFEAFPDNPDDKDADGVSNLRASINRALATKKPDSMAVQKYDVRNTNGSFEQRWWDPVNVPVVNAAGEVEAIIHSVADVSREKRAEIERAKALVDVRRLVAVVEQSTDFIGIADASGRGLYINHGARRMCGLPDDADPASFEITDFFPPEDREFVRDVVLPAQASLNGYHGELRFRRFNGQEPIAVSYDGFAIRDEHGEITAFATVTRDVTEVKRAIAMREAHNRILELALQEMALAPALDALVHIVEDLARSDMMASVLLLDDEGKRLLHGAGPSLPQAYNDAVHGIAVGEGVGSCGTAVSRKEPVLVADIATDPLWKDFRELALSHGLRACWSTPILSANGLVLGTFAIYHRQPRGPAASDFELVAFVVRSAALLIERKRAEIQLRESEERLRHLNETLERRVQAALLERKLLADVVEGADASLQVLDFNHRFLAINPRAQNDYEQIFGVRPVAGQTLEEVLAHLPDQLMPAIAVWRRVMSGEAFDEVGWWGDVALGRRAYEMQFRPLIDHEGKQIGAYLFSLDVTKRELAQRRLRDAEEALRQSQKMEAMGQLTGGVAHDFNNLLQPIVGSLDILRRRLTGERELRLIENAAQSAERARTLVQRLLAFARRQPLRATVVNIENLVVGISDLLRSTIGPQIDLVVEIDKSDTLPPAFTDPHQLEMALLNLSVNARDAMTQGGKLTISASAFDIGAGDISKLREGRYVRLSVADTGTGMDPLTMTRAIEPFFSTKGIGKGTGLGLSMVHGLTSQLGGGLTIESEPGVGTKINLWLPASEVGLHEVSDAVDELSAIRPAAGSVLLVDDEISVRTSTADMLEEMGYSVVHASSAEQALNLMRTGTGTDLVITDHLMPGITGVELARILRIEQPGLPVLLISGYAERQGVPTDLPSLNKPFRSDELARALSNIRMIERIE